MRCEEFRLSAEDRPVGAAAESPLLADHLAACAPCTRWNLDRAAWGPLGDLFRASARGTAALEAGEFADRMALRTRVRASIQAEARRPAPFFGIPAFRAFPLFGAAAAAALTLLVGVEAFRAQRTAPPAAAQESASLSGSFSPDRPALLGQTIGAETAQQPVAPPSKGSAPAAEPVRKARTASRPAAGSAAKPASTEVKVVRVGDDFGLEWAGAHAGPAVHRVIRSDDPRDFSRGETMMVSGNRWVDSTPEGEGPAGGGVHYYLID
jgi:hypothetical protein